MDSQQKRRQLLWGACFVVLVGVGLLASLMLGRAHVSGATPKERIESIRSIVGENRSGAVGALVEATKDPDATVRAEAVHGLGRLGSASARQAIISAAGDSEVIVRTAAVSALAGLSDAASVDRLAQIAADDSSPEVRLAAMNALGVCPAPQAIAALIGMMDNAKEPQAQELAAQVLIRVCRVGNLGHPRPSDGRDWEVAKTRLKADYHCQDAYKAMGKTLEYNPEMLPVHQHLRE